jgi:hypothetical protein
MLSMDFKLTVISVAGVMGLGGAWEGATCKDEVDKAKLATPATVPPAVRLVSRDMAEAEGDRSVDRVLVEVTGLESLGGAAAARALFLGCSCFCWCCTWAGRAAVTPEILADACAAGELLMDFVNKDMRLMLRARTSWASFLMNRGVEVGVLVVMVEVGALGVLGTEGVAPDRGND